MKSGVSKIEYLIIALLIAIVAYFGFQQEPVTATMTTQTKAL